MLAIAKKSVRNIFCRVGNIEIPGVEFVRWLHVIRQNNIQEREGLSAANKLTHRQVRFQQ